MGDAKFKIVSQSLKHQLQFFTGVFWEVAASKRRYERRHVWTKEIVTMPVFFYVTPSRDCRYLFTNYSAVALACFSTNFMLFHANFNLRSRQFFYCFSFGICKVRDTAARKLKRIQMILDEWCLGIALAWLGLALQTNQKTVCYTGYVHCHFPSSPNEIYLTFMMNMILFRTALTFSVSWLITLSFTDVHILRRQSVKSNFVYFCSFS